MNTKRINLFIVALALIGAALQPATTLAQPQAPSVSAEEPAPAGTEDAGPADAHALRWEGRSYHVEESRSGGTRVLVLRDEREREVWRGSVPSTALAFADDVTLNTAVLPRAGGLSLVEIRYDAEGIGNEPLQWKTVLMAESSRGSSFETIWSGREAAREAGGRLRLEDLDGDGREEIVLYAYSPSVTYCGGGLAPLYPRVYDEQAQRFREVSLRPAIPPGTRALSLTTSSSALSELNRWKVDAAPQSVSGDALNPLSRSYGPAPASLDDHDPATWWQEDGPNGGVGQFISFVVRTQTPLTALAFVPTPQAPLPAQAILQLESGSSYLIDFPRDSPHGTLVAQLPEPAQTRCASLRIVALHEGTDTTGFAEVLPLTVLDQGDPVENLDALILEPYLAAETALERDRLAELAVTDDPSVIGALAERIPELNSTQQPPLVETLLRSEFGRQAALELLMNGTLTAASIAAIGRVADDYPELLETMLTTARITDSTGTRVALLRVISRALDREDALELLPFVEDSLPASRSDLAFGLGQARLSEAATIANRLQGERTSYQNDMILLRALSRIGRRERPHGAPPSLADAAAGVRRTMQSENGTVARLAHQVAGILGIPTLVDDLQTSLQDDEHPMIRLGALRGLAHYHAYEEEPTLPNPELFAALQDEDPSIRIDAAQLLRERTLNESEAELVMQYLRTERWPEAQRALLTALVRQGQRDLDIALTGLLVDLDPNQRRTALVAWQSRREPPPASTLALFYEGAAGDETLMVALFRTVARIESDEAGAWLRRWYRDGQAEGRAELSLVEALGRQGSPESRELLIELLISDEVNIRRAAARGLAQYDTLETRHLLEAALAEETDPAARRSLERAIRAIRQGIGTRELLLNE